MSAIIMTSAAFVEDAKRILRESNRASKINPILACIIVGDNNGANVYSKGKKKDCLECGFGYEEYVLPATVTNEMMINMIKTLNADDYVSGIIIEMPLPAHIDKEEVLNTIASNKDIDCLSTNTCGRILLGFSGFPPCTPAAVMKLLDSYEIPVAGKECVIIGRSNIVGKPLAMLMTKANATVTLAHTKTVDLASVCKRADIIVSAAGSIGLVSKDMIKEGAVVIDVGINRDENGNLCGDVCFDEVKEVASYITPVPGGVGPMTRVIALDNLFRGANNSY